MGQFIKVNELENAEERLSNIFNKGITQYDSLEDVQGEIKDNLDSSNAVLFDILPDGVPLIKFRATVSASTLDQYSRIKVTITNLKKEKFTFRYSTLLQLDEKLNFDMDLFNSFLLPVLYRIATLRVAYYNAKVVEESFGYLTEGTNIKLGFTVQDSFTKGDIATIKEDGTVVLNINPDIDLEDTELELLVDAIEHSKEVAVNKEEAKRRIEEITGVEGLELINLDIEPEHVVNSEVYAHLEEYSFTDEEFNEYTLGNASKEVSERIETFKDLSKQITGNPNLKLEDFTSISTLEGKHLISRSEYKELIELRKDLPSKEQFLLNKVIDDTQASENIIVFLTSYKSYLNPFLIANLGKISVKNTYLNLSRSYGLKYDWVKSKGMIAKTHELKDNQMTLYERREKGGELVKVLPTFDVEPKLYV